MSSKTSDQNYFSLFYFFNFFSRQHSKDFKTVNNSCGNLCSKNCLPCRSTIIHMYIGDSNFPHLCRKLAHLPWFVLTLLRCVQVLLGCSVPDGLIVICAFRAELSIRPPCHCSSSLLKLSLVNRMAVPRALILDHHGLGELFSILSYSILKATLIRRPGGGMWFRTPNLVNWSGS